MKRKIIKNKVTGADFIDPEENYLGYLDFALNGKKEALFKIIGLSLDEIPDPVTGEKKNKIVLSLEGSKKVLIISKGKRKALVKLFGPFTNWVGNTIKLVADPRVKYMGKVTGGLVIQKAN